jgi:hypothetical protein
MADDVRQMKTALNMTRVYLKDLRLSLHAWASAPVDTPDSHWQDDEYVNGFGLTLDRLDILEKVVHDALGRQPADPDQPEPFS